MCVCVCVCVCVRIEEFALSHHVVNLEEKYSRCGRIRIIMLLRGLGGVKGNKCVLSQFLSGTV